MNRLRTNAYLKPCLRLISQQDESFVKIMFLNARSLHKHFLDVKNYLRFYSPDVAIFSETRLSVLDTIEEFEIEKYTLFRNDEAIILSNQRPFHGTAIYCCLSCKTGYPKCQNVFWCRNYCHRIGVSTTCYNCFNLQITQCSCKTTL